ncbi:hypothetical protein [Nocardia puris]|uniref:hypothetical protein n=1 Tax=Nocardia puris TaxID=208602 RepID=UPI002E24D76C
MRPPRGTQLREMGIALLGEHATDTGAHDDDLKPRALWLNPPGPRHPGLLQLTWLSDHWPPPRTPPRAGRLNWGQGTSTVEFRLRAEASTTTATALHHYFHERSDTETWTTCRLRTRSGVLFKRGHTHYLNAAHLLDATINRWHLVTSWTPPGTPRRDPPLPVPDHVAIRLRTGTALTVRHCTAASPHQIATKAQRSTPAIRETALEFDVDLHCTATDTESLCWFRTLLAFAEIASLGRYTPTGLGAVTATPADDATNLVEPELESGP